MEPFAYVIYSIILIFSILPHLLNKTRHFKKFPALTITFTTILIFTFALQIIFPQVLFQFERNIIAIASGEWWRLLTSLFFQDGGFIGALFNIVSLLIVGSLAEQKLKKCNGFWFFYLDFALRKLLPFGGNL